MAKKSATDGATSDQPGDAGGAGGTPSAPGKGLKKTVMFDHAMQALGRDAKPLQIQQWLKDHYQLDMKQTHISTYKTNWQKRNRRKPGPKPGQRSAANAPVAAKKGEATLDEIRHLKELIVRMGESRFRDLIDLLCLK